jgi:hypothetical protein
MGGRGVCTGTGVQRAARRRSCEPSVPERVARDDGYEPDARRPRGERAERGEALVQGARRAAEGTFRKKMVGARECVEPAALRRVARGGDRGEVARRGDARGEADGHVEPSRRLAVAEAMGRTRATRAVVAHDGRSATVPAR